MDENENSDIGELDIDPLDDQAQAFDLAGSSWSPEMDRVTSDGSILRTTKQRYILEINRLVKAIVLATGIASLYSGVSALGVYGSLVNILTTKLPLPHYLAYVGTAFKMLICNVQDILEMTCETYVVAHKTVAPSPIVKVKDRDYVLGLVLHSRKGICRKYRDARQRTSTFNLYNGSGSTQMSYTIDEIIDYNGRVNESKSVLDLVSFSERLNFVTMRFVENLDTRLNRRKVRCRCFHVDGKLDNGESTALVMRELISRFLSHGQLKENPQLVWGHAMSNVEELSLVSTYWTVNINAYSELTIILKVGGLRQIDDAILLATLLREAMLIKL